MKNMFLAIVCSAFLSYTQAQYYPLYSDYAPTVFIKNNSVYAEESCSSCVTEQELLQSLPSVQKPKHPFVHFIRPSLKTIKKMTSMLSWVFGAAAVIATISLLDRRESLTNDEIKSGFKFIALWLANKAIYHFSEYALEEID